jgi:asparagine synthase (glutamine-hydrolysing)
VCGISGTIGFVDQNLLLQMSDRIAHRGPDDSGIYVSPSGIAGLASRRLSIIDLTQAGHMPMSNDTGTLWIAYNGEVYNFLELRGELEQRGVAFRSRTDTEVVLRLFQQHGAGSFSRLNGIFAFALWDESSREMWLVRDRFGVKPLYYTQVGNQVLFSSEIKSILLDSRVSKEIDPEALHYFLAHLWVPGPQTMFQGIYKLPPGHYLRWRNGKFEVKPYWQIEWSKRSRPLNELTEELHEMLKRAIGRQLIADVPIGLYLSGGLDSTALLSFMSELRREPVETYTIAFRSQDAAIEQPDKSDAVFAEAVAKQFGARHHMIEVTPDIVNLLPRVIWHLDEPVADPAALNTLLIAEAARPNVKVLLSGQGADEVFAGYPVHFLSQMARSFSIVPPAIRNGLIRPAGLGLPKMAERLFHVNPAYCRVFERYFRKFLDAMDLPPVEGYIAARSYYGKERQLSLYSNAGRELFGSFDSGRRHQQYFDEVSDASFLNRILHVDLKTFLPELNLTYSDKLSMAASVELRVPFLDNEIVDFMSGVDPQYKIHGTTSKFLLRRAVRDRIPKSVLKRRKAGFKAPIRSWIKGDLNEMVHDYLSSATIRDRAYFDESAVQRLIADNESGIEDNSYQIWSLLTFEIWARVFIDQPVAAPIAIG